MDPIVNFTLKEAIKAGFALLKAKLAKERVGLPPRSEDLETKIQKHLALVSQWASQITLADLSEPKLTINVYVELDCYVLPKSRRTTADELVRKRPLAELITSEEVAHFVLLGTPGAGKTTSMRHVCLRLLTDENFASEKFNYPVLVRLRELNQSRGDNPIPVITHLAGVFGIEPGSPADLLEGVMQEATEAQRLTEHNRLINDRNTRLSEAICALLNETKVLLILDGFDELSEVQLRDAVLEDIRRLAYNLHASTMVVTARTGEFTAVVEQMKTFEICSLDEEQIREFAKRFFKNGKDAESFLTQVSYKPFHDSTIKPLTLAHLCAIYDRSGRIPEKPKTVYRTIISMLLDEWDRQRSVKRVSKYAAFASDRKFEFLSRLSFEETIRFGGTVFSSETVKVIYLAICQDFGLPEEQVASVVKEIESHTGLFLQCGLDQFEFAHKSLQEFLSAEYLVRLPFIPEEGKLLRRLSNELAIAVCISANASLYLEALVLKRFLNIRPGAYLSVPGPRLGAEEWELLLVSFVTRLLQEKPDFNSERAAMYALMVLCSMLIGIAQNRKDTRNVYELIDNVELLIGATAANKAAIKATLVELLKLYDKSSEGDAFIPPSAVRLVRNKTPGRLVVSHLTDVLFVRKKFYDRILSSSN